MGIFKCSHSWGFPQRWPEFNGKRNVDVQTCSKCGARRESPGFLYVRSRFSF